jgi:hypothetical protein
MADESHRDRFGGRWFPLFAGQNEKTWQGGQKPNRIENSAISRAPVVCPAGGSWVHEGDFVRKPSLVQLPAAPLCLRLVTHNSVLRRDPECDSTLRTVRRRRFEVATIELDSYAPPG